MQTESLTQLTLNTPEKEAKALLDKVAAFLDQLANDVTVRNYEAEELEARLQSVFDGPGGRMKLPVFQALQEVRKSQAKLQVFFKNR